MCSLLAAGTHSKVSDKGFNQFHWDFSASGSVRWMLSSVQLSWPFYHPTWDYFGLLPLWQPRKVNIILTFCNFSKCGLERGPRCARATHLCVFWCEGINTFLTLGDALGVKRNTWVWGNKYYFGVRGCFLGWGDAFWGETMLIWCEVMYSMRRHHFWCEGINTLLTWGENTWYEEKRFGVRE